MKKQTKQSRKTKARKDRQAIERQRAQKWTKTFDARLSQQMRQVVLMGATALRAPRMVYIDDSGPVKSNIWSIR